MDLTLAQIAAGWPLAASLAALAVRGVEGGRRRTALNECLHELRRPLQTLALAAPRGGDAEQVESCVRLAAQALERLDREINGGGEERAPGPVRIEPLLRSSLARWRARAELVGGSVQLRWRAGEATVAGDGGSLEQAVDNLIDNAIEHGGARVRVEARARAGWVAIAVVDSGPRPGRLPHRTGGLVAGSRGAGARRRRGDRRDRGDRRRHGHGLRVVRRVAAEHGGSFELRPSPQGTEALLRLPLCRTEVAGR